MKNIPHDQLVEYVRASTHDVFLTMLGIELDSGAAYLEHSGEPSSEGVLAFIGLAGSWAGTGALGCGPVLACRLCSQMLIAEYDSINDEVLDAMAELTNMIIGNVKTRLEESLGPMGLSIPTVIYGKNFSSRSIGSSDWTVVPFRYDNEQLLVRICLVPQGESSRPRIAVQEGLESCL